MSAAQRVCMSVIAAKAYVLPQELKYFHAKFYLNRYSDLAVTILSVK